MRPIDLIPWNRDFIAGLADMLADDAERNGGSGPSDLSRYLVVFPHRRPARYLMDRFIRSGRLAPPFLPPEIISVGELFKRLAAFAGGAPKMEPSILDRVALLHQSLLESLDTELMETARWQDPIRFYPWGMRLCALYDELCRHASPPRDIAYPEEDVEPAAVAILERFGRIFDIYSQALEDRGWTTPGGIVLDVLADLRGAVASLEGRSVWLAGFHALTGGEETLFRTLFQEAQARFVIHSDPGLAGSDRGHWSCEEHRKLARRWSASIVLQGEEPRSRRPEVHFWEGFDLHSQLDALSRELHILAEDPDARPRAAGDAAVVLPDTSMLLPCLHHLPDMDVNISMGYPLSRTPMYRLMDILFQLQEKRQGRKYHWRLAAELIRHPYVKQLGGEELSIRSLLRELESSMRRGETFTDPRELADRLSMETDQPDEAGLSLVRELLTACLDGFEQVETLGDLSRALDHVCVLLLNHGGELWQRHLMDGECLHRIMFSLCPELSQCEAAETPMELPALLAIVRHLLDMERVPFEADPLTGLQVLGMLETRVLRFKHLYVIGATEDRMPGPPPSDPLMPEALRAVVGLPDARTRDRVAAYHFHRLLACAEKVVVCYEMGVQGGLMERKSVRSRFVEELVWEREQSEARIIKPGQDPIGLVRYPLCGNSPVPRDIARTPDMDRAVNVRMGRGLSPTALDDYIRCPARFYYLQVAGIEPADTVQEAGDWGKLGTLVHGVLQDHFHPFIGQDLVRPTSGESLAGTAFDLEALEEVIARHFEESDVLANLAYDERLFIELATRRKLASYLAIMPDTRILHLEQRAEAAIPAPSGSQILRGFLDRVDKRQGRAVILDYKTGNIHKPSTNAWQGDPVWGVMREGYDPDIPDVLPRLFELFPSVQLPAYLFLHSSRHAEPAHDAALVELKDRGEERSLFGEKLDEERRQNIVQERIPLLLGYLVEHMRNAPVFAANQGPHCDYCDYGPCCLR